jgi:hypothetical protein
VAVSGGAGGVDARACGLWLQEVSKERGLVWGTVLTMKSQL